VATTESFAALFLAQLAVPGAHLPSKRSRCKLRSTIKRLLAKYGYPPDAQPAATELVIRQMETFADEWAPSAS
jgi:restriction endonuclease HindI-like protein